MKKFKWYMLGVFILSVELMSLTTIDAQESITVTPAQLVVTGTRGAVATRRLLLRTATPVAGLQIVALDLPRADGDTVLPASAIKAALSADKTETNGMLTMPLTIDLHNVSSGEFKGELLVRFQNGALSVPVTVRVKDLAGAGFGELYVANATFGTNAWGDYFALLAWGFGTEATRASVTEMVKGWGLMGGK